jgi:glyoxalase family protein
MNRQIPGIHHVTAIAVNPQQNIDFYTGFLGLRLVKLTVNFDDPASYHLYYGDSVGHPGTILTFFAWPGGPRGRLGAGQVVTTSFAIPEASVDYWAERLREHGVDSPGPIRRFGWDLIAFSDPDGLQLELVAGMQAEGVTPWEEGPVPIEHATRGFHGITMAERSPQSTESLLAETLGFKRVLEEKGRSRFKANSDASGRVVEILSSTEERPGRVAAGTVHHVAWRTNGDEDQLAWKQQISQMGMDVTPVADRKYFHSIYFHEPGGVLFEIATDPPGFTVDEPERSLGTRLMLPSWLEPVRAKIERSLPPLHELRRAA